MSTVEYGDISPTNNLEIAFSIVTMFIACGLFGYTMNTIATIVTNINLDKEKALYNLMII